MGKKEELAEKYTDSVTGLDYIGVSAVESAYMAGWDAAVTYLANLPLDKMLKYFESVLKNKPFDTILEENKDV